MGSSYVFFIYLKRCSTAPPEMRRLFFPPALEQVRKHVLTGDFAAQNDHDQNQADRQIEVLRAHAEAERQTVTKNADDQRREHRADDAALGRPCSACRRARQL